MQSNMSQFSNVISEFSLYDQSKLDRDIDSISVRFEKVFTLVYIDLWDLFKSISVRFEKVFKFRLLLTLIDLRSI